MSFWKACPDFQAVADRKRMPIDVIPVARFFWHTGISRLSYSPMTIEIPASHKKRAGMTRSCRVISANLQQPVKTCGHDTYENRLFRRPTLFCRNLMLLITGM